MTDVVDRTDQGVPEPPPIAGRRRLPRWAVLAAVAAGLALLAWVIGFSSVLGVRSVQVRGARSLSAAQVRQVAAIRSGAPLLRLDTAAIQRRLAALPVVRSARVTTSYPSTVTIRILERVAAGYRFAPGGVTVVDADDVAFGTAKTPPKGLPRIDVSGSVDRMDAAAAVAGSLTTSMARKVALITAPTPESVTLTLSDGRTVLWGGTDHSADKAKLLPALITQPGTYFDLSDPTSVISRGAPSTGN